MTCAALGPRHQLAYATAAGEVGCLHEQTGESQWHAQPHVRAVHALVAAPDGWLYSGGQDGAVWRHTQAGESSQLLEARGWVEALAVQGADLWAAVGQTLWLLSPHQVPALMYRAASTISGLQASPDGRVTLSHYGGLTRVSRDAEAAPIEYRWKGSLRGVSGSPDGRWLVAPSQEATLQIWRSGNGEALEMRGFAGRVAALAWQPDSRVLVAASATDLSLWDFRGAGPEGKVPRALSVHNAPVAAVAMHPNQPWLLSADQAGQVAVTELGIGRATVRGEINTHERVLGCLWLAAGDGFVVWTAQGTLACWRLVGQGRA